jgi:hypothetical protein
VDFDEELITAKVLRNGIVETLSRWVRTIPDPDRPLIGYAGRGVASLTPRQIVEHVQEGTPFGNALVQRWMRSALENVVSMEVENSFDLGGPDPIVAGEYDEMAGPPHEHRSNWDTGFGAVGE